MMGQWFDKVTFKDVLRELCGLMGLIICVALLWAIGYSLT